jgi:hypothetical protein
MQSGEILRKNKMVTIIVIIIITVNKNRITKRIKKERKKRE